MGSVSQFIKNGQQSQTKAGSAAIVTGDQLVIGGPGNEAYTLATIDYAKNMAASSLVGQTSVVAAALPGGSRQQLARDAQGNIFYAGTNSSGNLVIYKYSPLLGTTTSAVVDAVATTVRTSKFFQLSNGTFACVYARTAGALYFAIVDASLSVVVGPTSIATEYAVSNVVFHDAIPLNGGGLGIVYQSSAGTSTYLQTYSNLGAAVLVATNIQTLAGTTAQQFLRLGQLPNGNLVCGLRGTMTVGGTAGTSWVIVNTSGVNQFGPTNIDSTSTLGFLELSIISGGTTFSLAEANGTTLRCSVYSQTGALQGVQYSIADTLNSTTYPQVKLTNDGSQYWLAYFGSAANGLNVVQVPIAGATAGQAVTGLSSATLSATTYALDAEIINGMLVALAASSSTSGQYWMTVGLPDPSLGIVVPYLRTTATAIGSAAATTGSNWPRILSGGGGLYQGTSAPANQPTNPPTNGDWTAIFCYDQQTVAGSFIAVQKVEASAIIGMALSPVAVGNAGTLVSVNAGPGSYVTNPVAGTVGTSFNHLGGSPVGQFGVITASAGITLGNVDGAVAASSISGTIMSAGGNSVPPGYMGVFGNGLWQVFSASSPFTVPANVTAVRVRVVGGGGGGRLGGAGGGGGGYAHGIFAVAPGNTFPVTVGVGGTGSASPTSGGTSSFSTLISATGGAASSGSTAAAGGVGVGGTFQATGGSSGATGYSGGGAAGSQLGNGGNGGIYSGTSYAGGGGGVGNGNGASSVSGTSMSGGGGSPFGPPAFVGQGSPDALGNMAANTALAGVTAPSGATNPINATVRFLFDGFPGGGGAGTAQTAASSNGGNGGIGGGGGGCYYSTSSAYGGNGGIGGGGGGGYNGGNGGMGGGGGAGANASGIAGNGGQGLVIVEW